MALTVLSPILSSMARLCAISCCMSAAVFSMRLPYVVDSSTHPGPHSVWNRLIGCQVLHIYDDKKVLGLHSMQAWPFFEASFTTGGCTIPAPVASTGSDMVVSEIRGTLLGIGYYFVVYFRVPYVREPPYHCVHAGHLILVTVQINGNCSNSGPLENKIPYNAEHVGVYISIYIHIIYVYVYMYMYIYVYIYIYYTYIYIYHAPPPPQRCLKVQDYLPPEYRKEHLRAVAAPKHSLFLGLRIRCLDPTWGFKAPIIFSDCAL